MHTELRSSICAVTVRLRVTMRIRSSRRVILGIAALPSVVLWFGASHGCELGEFQVTVATRRHAIDLAQAVRFEHASRRPV